MADLVFPHHALDAGSRAASAGMTAEGWSKVAFLEAPVSDGCGLPFDYEMGPGVRCAKALLKAGAQCVDLAVIARVREAGSLSI